MAPAVTSAIPPPHPPQLYHRHWVFCRLIKGGFFN
uniref:Uncharacterized protein n=1 Tax=Anguilla anguilla TaxID=7936 RepID=A0A0E9WIZ7_ANGAN